MSEEKLTFDTLMDRPSKTETESVLIQAIAALSTQGQYASMTPWEVFECIQADAQEVDKMA